ncbi:hypothetical protein TRFO_32943 [Tritrichomonas foetus]|uniref:Uncharacterized protein n=1 Tax=Tritrichomonas foetus TaxID=1144522 RepID=A0A1J4JMV3_9EUKA|nr:hypothetical protein TRFO_32943 [Tritrichomonas foetus]|eukprot:OHT00403.1 hypothetical protein TRFO_32943 [Tritrichomonas foetus]
MFSLFDDGDDSFGVCSSPITYPQQDNDFSLSFQSASPNRVADTDYFLEFSGFDIGMPDMEMMPFGFIKNESPIKKTEKGVSRIPSIPVSQPEKTQKLQQTIVEPVKHKPRRKVESFQPFASFSSLEQSVKILRSIVGTAPRVCAPVPVSVYN